MQFCSRGYGIMHCSFSQPELCLNPANILLLCNLSALPQLCAAIRNETITKKLQEFARVCWVYSALAWMLVSLRFESISVRNGTLKHSDFSPHILQDQSLHPSRGYSMEELANLYTYFNGNYIILY